MKEIALNLRLVQHIENFQQRFNEAEDKVEFLMSNGVKVIETEHNYLTVPND